MNQKQEYTTVGEYFRSSKILFGAFTFGVFNFGVVLAVLFYLDYLPLKNSLPGNERMIEFGIIILSIITISAGKSFTKKIFKSTTTESTLKLKLSIYRKGVLIKFVFIELALLLTMVFFLFSPSVIYAILIAIGFIQMIRNFPSRSNLEAVMELSYSDQQKLNDPDFKLN